MSDHENEVDISIPQTIADRTRRNVSELENVFEKNHQYTISTLTKKYDIDQKDNKPITRELKNLQNDIADKLTSNEHQLITNLEDYITRLNENFKKDKKKT